MLNQVNVYTIANPQDWQSAIKRMTYYDFYHTYSYNAYFSSQESHPLLFSYKEEDVEIVMPFLLRRINKTSYYDVTSVYGYAGPLSSTEEVKVGTVNRFLQSLNNFFEIKNVVSAFSRLHPSFQNEKLLNGLGTILSLSSTVFIDLSENIDFQRSQFRKGAKSDLSRLYKEDFVIFEDENKEFVDEFMEIYNENMTRVGAKEEYIFDKSYYQMIFESPDIKSRLYFVTKNNMKIAASIFVFTGQMIQYHLSATRNEFLKNSPVRLIIDNIRLKNTQSGFKELHLGGGVGSVEDSLFKFKSGFSNQRHVFKIWKYIVNEAVYNSLVKQKGEIQNANFFPLYRSI